MRGLILLATRDMSYIQGFERKRNRNLRNKEQGKLAQSLDVKALTTEYYRNRPTLDRKDAKENYPKIRIGTPIGFILFLFLHKYGIYYHNIFP